MKGVSLRFLRFSQKIVKFFENLYVKMFKILQNFQVLTFQCSFKTIVIWRIQNIYFRKGDISYFELKSNFSKILSSFRSNDIHFCIFRVFLIVFFLKIFATNQKKLFHFSLKFIFFQQFQSIKFSLPSPIFLTVLHFYHRGYESKFSFSQNI